MISDKFILHGLNKQVNQRARECLHCQAAKVKTHVHAPLNNFNGPEKRFSYIIVDMCTSPESVRIIMLLIASLDHLLYSNVALGVDYPAMAAAQPTNEDI